MKIANVIVPWPQGLHLRVASQIVQIARSFRSQVHLQFESTLADATSVLSLILLEASPGSQLVLQAAGDDEHEAIQALQGLFTGPQEERGAPDCAPEGAVALWGNQPA